ncbi:hypothetical protein CANARDRAFT_201408 [[Candida] arabinofermentans NRRL YB-2248]|uniref:mitogen-activated protein kinase kinase kinase n=1 Tax=[Candida] arabinofermentans NRRL YB-2248 TaxID=983967 RepID=A0A1E4SXS5_9ASCO|nr:hypothetical protein CANARDRAFT_201408 [[Candida] arabinofermentans NRRL YB-2248]
MDHNNLHLESIRSKYTLSQYLKTVDCEEYLGLLVENDITAELLPQLDKHALKEIGVTKVGDRLRLQILIHQLNTEKLKSKIPINDLIETIASAKNTLNSVEERMVQNQFDDINKSSSSTPTSNEFTNTVTVITSSGSTATVDITGCFNSASIKKKALKKIGIPNPVVSEWNAYYVEKDEFDLHLMFDVELTTICHSVDRIEKNRIILCHRSEKPSEAAIEKSKLIIDPSYKSKDQLLLKNFMGQRPPSQLISTNLGEYFPSTGVNQLKEVMRNSVRLTLYSSKLLQQQLNQQGIGMNSNNNHNNNNFRSSILSVGIPAAAKPTIGDVILNNTTSADTILALKDDDSTNDVYKTALDSTAFKDPQSNHESNKLNNRMSVSYTKKTADLDNDKRASSIIELFDDEEDDEFFDSSDDAMASLYDTSKNEGPSLWHKGSKIGQGSFGTVYLGLNGLTGELMAIKQVALPSTPTESSKVMTNALKQEMLLLKVLNHQNIVRYLGSSSDANNLYIFLEYIPGGSVASMLSTYGPFEEPLVRNFVAQVLIGLKYLHNEGIIHRDIKGANILIDINGTVKISDFGISKKIELDQENSNIKKEREMAAESKESKRASLQGSVYWMAPEVVKQIAYTDKADIWSVGCLIVEMFTGKHPYPGFSQMQAIFRIGTLSLPEIPKKTTDDARKFLALTFETDYTKRVGASELLKHSFLTPLIATDN